MFGYTLSFMDTCIGDQSHYVHFIGYCSSVPNKGVSSFLCAPKGTAYSHITAKLMHLQVLRGSFVMQPWQHIQHSLQLMYYYIHVYIHNLQDNLPL